MLLLVAACAGGRKPAEGAPAPVARVVSHSTPSGQPPADSPVAPPAKSATPTALPAAAPGFLKGETHVHTARSYDAHTPPVDVLAFYAARGYDFVALTDHNRVTVVKPPDGLLLIPGVEFTQNSKDCTPPPPSGYRCLFHTTGLFVDPSRDRFHGGLIHMPFQRGRMDAYRWEVRHARELGGVAVLDHPLFHFAANASMIAQLAHEGLKLVELFNASLDGQFPGGQRAAEDRAERLWNDVLDRGILIYGMATDDAHHFADAADRRRHGRYAYVGDRAWIMVRAEKRPAAIRSALLAGHFYDSTGVTLRSLERSAQGFHLVVEPQPGEKYAIRFVGRRGKLLSRVEGPEASYRIRGDEGWVRAVVDASSGHRAWIQPVMVAGPAG